MKFNTSPDGSFGVEFDIETVVADRWDKILSVFGRDSASTELKDWIKRRTRFSLETAKYVQIVGMYKPVELETIYQPTRLVAQPRIGTLDSRNQSESERFNSPAMAGMDISISEFLEVRVNSVIKAGPGWGKTTFIHSLFLRLLKGDEYGTIPVLFTLRIKEAVDQLKDFVDLVSAQKKKDRSKPFVLLVDGYDEVSTEIRNQISTLLLQFAALECGVYILTCRDHYDTYFLKARELRIAEFVREDQVLFMRTYFDVFERPDLQPEVILDDLCSRGFDDLMRHPLLMTLACIVKTSDLELRFRSSASLIETALNALSLRWDQEKPIRREATTPLNSIQRSNLLKRLAFSTRLEGASQNEAINVIQPVLDRMSYRDVEPLDVLREIAQFYGVFVPVGTKWAFVHRSLKDFLAAQEWVESGEFSVAIRDGVVAMDSRTAFAACRRPDATDVMVLTLETPEGVPVFLEMLLNEPGFDMKRVLGAIRNFFNAGSKRSELGATNVHPNRIWTYQRNNDAAWCYLPVDLIKGSSAKFLDYAVGQCCSTDDELDAAIAIYAIFELRARKLPVSITSFDNLSRRFPSPEFSMAIQGRGRIKVGQVMKKETGS